SDNMVRQENIETASTVTSIIPDSTVSSEHNSTVIVTQNNQPEPISSEVINLHISNTLQKAKNLANRVSYNPSSSSKNGNRCDYGRGQPGTEGKGADTATISLSGHIQSQPQSIQQFPAVQGVPDPCRSVKNCMNSYLTERKFLGHPDTWELLNGWHPLMEKKKHDSLDTRMEEKQPFTTQASDKNSPSGQQQQLQREKAATSSKQGQRKATSHQALQPGLQDAMENVFQMARTMMELQRKRRPDSNIRNDFLYV
ncbi:hypothetical protein O181_130854, partial [Austropuccinia psidii MF-1]|nr:hypothetical protein [Austropuccinia psidii MF-1]